MRGAVTIKGWNVRWAMGTRSGVVGGFGEGRKEGRNEWGGWGRRGPGPEKPWCECAPAACLSLLLGMGIWEPGVVKGSPAPAVVSIAAAFAAFAVKPNGGGRGGHLGPKLNL